MDTYTVLAKPVETNRLILRKFVEGDEIPLFHEYCGDRESSKYLQRRPHANIEQTKCMFENWSGTKWKNNDKDFAWIIGERKTNLAMGLVMFIHKGDHGEIHFGLGGKFQGQGFMREAITAVIVYLKNNSRLKRIETFCDAENMKSRNVLIETGFTETTLLKHWAIFPALGDNKRDCLGFMIEINKNI
ncbi:GNAT family N-acetyltransferase [Acinetobacter guillouiae]|uniref:GNAT family N-acetyltransferase n=1 Tax=Acinetobacter guillouiae TaxID=106649 RepID=UPI0030092D63